MGDQPPLIVLIGPTASGKSSLAIRLATLLAGRGKPAEIVNADSMLVYRGMNIGTAKPSADELARVPHHLVDIMEITETASVADFQSMARATIERLRRGGIAVLAERHPSAAASILAGNGRRIVRALEVIELTGDFSPRLPEPVYALPRVHQFGLQLERDEMDARIAQRVEQMWADGFVDEVRDLAARGLREGLTASRGLGYQQVLAYLAGELSEQEAKQATIDGTRRFARKQLGWFARDPRIHWLQASDPRAAETITEILGV